MSRWSPETYIKTMRFAAHAHQGQTLPGSNIPYLAHLSFVSMEVIAALETETERDGDLAIQCALLHDVIEDTPTTADQVGETFGPKVLAGVLALTKDKTLPTKEKQMEDSLSRIRAQPLEVWMVKLADRISNLQVPPPYWDREKKAAYRDEALLIHNRLQGGSSVLAKRLQEKIEAYKNYLA